MPNPKLKYITFLLAAVLTNAESLDLQNVPDRFKIFDLTFLKSLNSSPQALQVFDISVLPIQASNDIYQTLKESLRTSGLQHHDSLAKVIADSVFLTLPLLTQKLYVTAFTRTMALYLISQNILTVDNAEVKGNQFFSAILNNFPEKDNVTSLTLSRALSVGIVDFLKAQGESTLRNSPSVIMSIADVLFAHSSISKPLVEVTVVSPPGLIPAAVDLYGITSFSSTFLRAVDSSLALKSIFYSNQSILELSKAWESAGLAFCTSIECYDPHDYRYDLTVLGTYNYMSKSTYVKSIANAFALTMVAKGTLTLSNSIAESWLLAKTMETLSIDLPENSELDIKLGVIFTAFKNLLKPDDNIRNLYPVFGLNIQFEFFAAVPVSSDIIF